MGLGPITLALKVPCAANCATGSHKKFLYRQKYLKKRWIVYHRLFKNLKFFCRTTPIRTVTKWFGAIHATVTP